MNDSEIPGPIDIPKAPYPEHLRTTAFTKDGFRITIRPIRPEDAPLLVDLFNRLSKETIFFRFLADLKFFPEEWLPHFTQIDYTRDVVMVAGKEIDYRERILGVCRIMRRAGATRAELAVVVEDDWQGKGIGNALVHPSMRIAKDLGIKVLWGSASSDNTKTLIWAQRLGFSAKRDPITDLYELEKSIA